MTYPVYICIFFCLILLQTVVLPAFFDIVHGYDLFIVFVIYMGFFRSMLESLPAVLFIGIVMDCFSGGAFGIYTTTYLWLCVAVRGVIQYLHVDSRVLLPIAIVLGVLLENLITLLTVIMGSSSLGFSYTVTKIVLFQVVWAILTGPLLFLFIKHIHMYAETWFKESFGSENEPDDFK